MEGHDKPNPTATDPLKHTTPGLLRLPPHVRERIFRHLDMVEPFGHMSSFDLHGRDTTRFKDPAQAMDGMPVFSHFRGLLRCCRTIYAEAAAILYSSNRFFIYYSGPGSLKPLHALTPTALASLARLKVILNQSSCHHLSSDRDAYWCCYNIMRSEEYDISSVTHCHLSWDIGKHRYPLANCPPFHYEGEWRMAQIVLDEWQAAVAHMSTHITAGKLQLSLVCDIDDEQTDAIDVAKRAVAPLQILPRLKECSVRLCATPTRRFRLLAQDAALQACRSARPYNNPHPTRTTFATLPRELRIRILEYTDLITPFKEVGWSRERPQYAVYDGPDFMEENGGCYYPIHDGCQFISCDKDRYYSEGCFCRRRHSTFSSKCRCWVPPGPALFLVCRTLCQDAQFVFFSGNRFIVSDISLGMCGGLFDEPSVWLGDRNTQAAGSYPYDRFVVSQFVREVVPPHCLAYIRFLELVFPPYAHHVWPRPEHPAMKDWCATVDWLKDKINGPRLTVRLVMADTVDGRVLRSDREHLTELEGKAIVRAYMNISSPLRHLTLGDTGLAMFHAEFAYPWAWTDVTRAWLDRHPYGYHYLEVPQRELEEFAERYVMGDRYKEVDDPDNRELPRKSMWQFWAPLDY